MENCDDAYGFPPYPVIQDHLHRGTAPTCAGSNDARPPAALTGLPSLLLRSSTMDWWQRLPRLVDETAAVRQAVAPEEALPVPSSRSMTEIDAAHRSGADQARPQRPGRPSAATSPGGPPPAPRLRHWSVMRPARDRRCRRGRAAVELQRRRLQQRRGGLRRARARRSRTTPTSRPSSRCSGRTRCCSSRSCRSGTSCTGATGTGRFAAIVFGLLRSLLVFELGRLRLRRAAPG